VLCAVAACAVPRPVGHVPGLSTAKAIGATPGTQEAFLTLVEAYMYPGDGQLTVTALGVRAIERDVK
jgi:hypothetical protein